MTNRGAVTDWMDVWTSFISSLLLQCHFDLQLTVSVDVADLFLDPYEPIYINLWINVANVALINNNLTTEKHETFDWMISYYSVSEWY